MSNKYFRLSILGACILCALASGVGAAKAEDGQATQSEPAAPEQKGTSADTATLGEITIKGYGGSLQRAQLEKRDSAQVIEAVAPEDLGKFSDNSIADVLQRVPGVQIDRGTDARTGDRVSVRGMGSQFITVTVNGRTPAAYGNGAINGLREFPIDIFPSEILSGAKVYKTPSAELIESGLGGGVEVETLRPLDYTMKNGGNYFGSLTVKGDNTSTGHDWGGGASGLFGGKLLDNTLGFYVAGVYDDTKYLQNFMELRPQLETANVRQSDGSVTQHDAIFPHQAEVGNMRRDFRRHALSADVQWAPSESLEFNFDYLYSQYDRTQNRDYVELTNYDAGTGIFEPGGIKIQNGFVTGLDYSHYTPATGGANPGSAVGFQELPLVEYYRDELQIGGINGKWNSGKWRVEGDLSFNKTVASDTINIFYSLTGIPNPGANLINYTANTSGPATFNYGSSPPSVTSAGPFNPGLGIHIPLTNHSNGRAFKFDVAFEANDALTLKSGYRYSTTDVDIRNVQYTTVYTAAQNAAMQKILYPGGVDTVVAGIRMPTSDPQAVMSANNGFFPNWSLDAPPFTGPFSALLSLPSGWSLLGNFPSHLNHEKTSAWYGQADVTSEAFGLPWTGNFGVRVVNTREDAQAFESVTYINGTGEASGTPSPAPTLVMSNNSYTSVLPAMNLKADLGDGRALRFAVARTMSRPEFEDMAPMNALSVPDPSLHLSINGNGTIGNGALKPEMAWNYDTTFEALADDGASFVASVFYKQVSDFIAPSTVHNVTLPGFGSQLFDVSQAENYSSGKAYGLELGFNVPLKRLYAPLDGVGLQANYTLTYSAVDKPFGGQTYSFPGASRHNINAILYYDHGPIDARLSLVYRTSYLSAYPLSWSSAYPVYTDGSLTLDASTTYQFSERFDLTLTGSNLTGQARRDYIFNTTNFFHYYQNPRTVTLAGRFHF